MLAWSSGKDSCWALHVLRSQGDVQVAGLLTTLNRDANRVSMHAVRERLLDAQAQALDLPLLKVHLPNPCSNQEYEAAMSQAMTRAKARLYLPYFPAKLETDKKGNTKPREILKPASCYEPLNNRIRALLSDLATRKERTLFTAQEVPCIPSRASEAKEKTVPRISEWVPPPEFLSETDRSPDRCPGAGTAIAGSDQDRGNRAGGHAGMADTGRADPDRSADPGF